MTPVERLKFKEMAVNAMTGHFLDGDFVYQLGQALEKAVDFNPDVEKLETTVEELETKVEDLEFKVDELETKVEELEKPTNAGN